MLDEAVAEFQRALYIESRYARAHNNLGVALLEQGNVDAAVAEFRSVLANEPRNVDALVNLALAEKAAGRPGELRTQNSERRTPNAERRSPNPESRPTNDCRRTTSYEARPHILRPWPKSTHC
jgi:Flp pilus assembly protein TadD